MKSFFHVKVYQFDNYFFHRSSRDIDCIKRNWRSVGGVFICGYEKFGKLMENDESTFDGCDLLVCDEGHTLKNPLTAKSKVANKVRTSNRIILSGTPLQNNLDECKWINYYRLCIII